MYSAHVFFHCKVASLAQNLISSSSIKLYQPQNTNSFTDNKIQFNTIQLYFACILKIFPKPFFMKVKGDRNLCPKHFPLQVQIRNLNYIMMINNVIQLRGDDRTIAINPRTTKINAHTTGFFLTQSSDEVKR